MKAAGDGSLVNRMLLRWYKPVLYFSLNNRKILIPSTLAVAAASFVLFYNLGSDFIPKLNEGDMVIGLVRNTSMSIDESVRLQKISEKTIMEFKEIESVFSRMGTPESATDPMGVNFADTFVILKKDPSQWSRLRSSATACHRCNRRITVINGTHPASSADTLRLAGKQGEHL